MKKLLMVLLLLSLSNVGVCEKVIYDNKSKQSNISPNINFNPTGTLFSCGKAFNMIDSSKGIAISGSFNLIRKSPTSDVKAFIKIGISELMIVNNNIEFKVKNLTSLKVGFSDDPEVYISKSMVLDSNKLGESDTIGYNLYSIPDEPYFITNIVSPIFHALFTLETTDPNNGTLSYQYDIPFLFNESESIQYKNCIEKLIQN